MSHDNVDDLIALSRRGLLSEPETRRLRMALQTSDTARALHEVGLSFDTGPTRLPGDSELLARVARRVASQTNPTAVPVGISRRQRFFFAAVALLVAGASAAGVASSVLDRGPDAGDPEAAQPPPNARTTASSGSARKVPPSSTALGEASANETATPVAQLDPGAASHGATPKEPPVVAGEPTASAAAHRAPTEAVARTESLTADALFKAANAARKAGDAASALDQYRQLQRAFPASPEAGVSRVLAGRLLLSAGQPSGALAQFDGYLRGGPQGGLGEEALWGKGQALAQLGRSSEERAVWQLLLRTFPKSVYAATARQRLQR